MELGSVQWNKPRLTTPPVPEAMRIPVNVTVTSPSGPTQLVMQDGLFTKGHQPAAIATVTPPFSGVVHAETVHRRIVCRSC